MKRPKRKPPVPEQALSARPYWLQGVAQPQNAPTDLPEVALPATVDVVVVGAGRSGLAAAQTLAQAGTSVAVLEERGVGRGVAGRELGLVMPWPIESPNRLMAAMGKDTADFLLRLAHKALGQEATEGLVLATLGGEDRELDECLDLCRPYFQGYASTKAKDLPGSKGQCQALSAPALLQDPSASLRARFRSCLDAGATVHEGVSALGIESRGALRQIVQTSHGPIACSVVILCCGWKARDLSGFVRSNTLRRRVSAVDLSQADGEQFAVPWGRAARGYLRWRRHEDHLLLEGASWASVEFDFGQDRDDQADPAVLDALWASAPKDWVPWRWWSRVLCSGRDALPLLGPVPGSPTIVVATGFGDDGALFAQVCGEEAARRVLDQPPSRELDVFSTRRFL